MYSVEKEEKESESSLLSLVLLCSLCGVLNVYWTEGRYNVFLYDTCGCFLLQLNLLKSTAN